MPKGVPKKAKADQPPADPPIVLDSDSAGTAADVEMPSAEPLVVPSGELAEATHSEAPGALVLEAPEPASSSAGPAVTDKPMC